MELTQYLAIARRWWWLLVIATLVGGATAYLVSQLATPTYRATATLLVVQQQDPTTVGLADLQASERLANTFTRLVTVRPVLDSAIERGGLALTPEELEERVSVSSPATTQLLEVSAEASTPEAARDLANIVAESFIAYNDPAVAARPGVVTIVERAEAPLRPVAPSVTLNALIGAFLALAAAGAIVAIAEYLDDTVKDDDRVTELTGLPVIGHVVQFAHPAANGSGSRAGVHPQSPESEAYRSIRTNVTYNLAGSEKASRLLVTSPGPGEGKSTTVANLAVVFGLAGSRVLVVDADLRRPSQHRMFGLPNSSGLSNVLTRADAPVQKNIQRTSRVRVWLLPSGPIPANPSELLGSPRMRDLLETLDEHFDILLIDSPPALAVTDAAVLSSGVSATIVVTQHGKTRHDELRAAVQRIAMAGQPIAGIVVNRIAGGRAGYYYPEYGSISRPATEREPRPGSERERRPVPEAPREPTIPTSD